MFFCLDRTFLRFGLAAGAWSRPRPRPPRPRALPRPPRPPLPRPSASTAVGPAGAATDFSAASPARSSTQLEAHAVSFSRGSSGAASAVVLAPSASFAIGSSTPADSSAGFGATSDPAPASPLPFLLFLRFFRALSPSTASSGEAVGTCLAVALAAPTPSSSESSASAASLWAASSASRAALRFAERRNLPTTFLATTSA
mmetsp:Transcript_1669/g.4288  ORF Transcript_1669/g.4288 Transcript_1669/m.4288 type:complete len:200 (+) Transcript_1669:43-642(+)